MKELPHKLVDVIIPTYNNPQYLIPCIESLLGHSIQNSYVRIIIINNGHERSLDRIPADGDNIIIYNAKENLGWEGGLKKGLELSDSEFVMFLNDDTYFPNVSSSWLPQTLSVFADPKVAAVGPSSNVVTGYQNIFARCHGQMMNTDYLIGFCMMIRRKYLDEVGGVDADLPGGDDFDLSMRFTTAGYKLVILRNVFVYHHGFITGTKTKGDSTVPNGWNSPEMQEKTNIALVKKHGFLKFWETICNFGFKQYNPDFENNYNFHSDNPENEIIKIAATKGKVIELGCGTHKIFEDSIGVDVVQKGIELPKFHSIDGVSVADVICDVSGELPIECGNADTIIAQHVLEHMIDPISTLGHWKNSLKDDGVLILAVPNEEICYSIPLNPEHYHAFTPSSLNSLLEACGFKRTFLERKVNNIAFVSAYQKVKKSDENSAIENDKKNLQKVR